MDPLDRIMSLATDDELLMFRKELVANSAIKLELILWDHMCSDHEWPDDSLMRTIYNPPNPDAYHSLRKRLLNAFSSFLAKRKFAEEQVGYIPLLRILANADTMMERNDSVAAMHFFNKAERKAIKQHKYILLHALYSAQQSNVLFLGLDPLKIEKKMQANFKNLQTATELNSAFAIILAEYNEHIKLGTKQGVETIFDRIYQNEILLRSAANDAEFSYKMVVLVRSVVLAAKEYRFFQPFILKVYFNLKSKDAFYDGPSGLEIRFVYMIAQCYYRQWNFDEVNIWLSKMDECLPKLHRDRHPIYPKSVMMNAASHLYGNDPHQGVKILSEALDLSGKHLPQYIVLNMLLNLSVAHFCTEDYKMANQTILKIHQSISWLDKHMGREWRMKMEIILVIFLYELKHPDLAEARILAIRKGIQSMLHDPHYARADGFLKLILRLIHYPEIAWTSEFAAEVEKAGLKSPTLTEDIQAVTFFCWLLSKMQRRKYYDVLMEWVAKERAKED